MLDIKINCKYFKGDIPCKPHKEYQVHCENCSFFSPIGKKILIIKLGAIGDVIRSTPLLRKLKTTYQDCYIYWLTYSPEVLSENWVDKILPVTLENIESLKALDFDWLINLDKDPIAIALTKTIRSEKKSGFIIDEYGRAKSISSEAEKHKWLTGIFDDISKRNNKHYVREIFEICGFNFENEEYILEIKKSGKVWNIDKSKKVIGLNTGCGSRWISRLWPISYWIELARSLLNKNFEVILLGGKDEDQRNKEIQKHTGAKYFGFYEINEFIDLVNECDLIVTAVTMALHIAIALKKKIVLFNNVFNKNEFYLYGLGEILEPDYECNCFYKSKCENNCMNYLLPNKVERTIHNLIKQ